MASVIAKHVTRKILDELSKDAESNARMGDIRRLFEAVLNGDVEHIEDLVPPEAPPRFRELVVGLTSIVRDVAEGRMDAGEALWHVARLIGVDPVGLLLSFIG